MKKNLLVDFRMHRFHLWIKLSAVTAYPNSNPVARTFFKLRGKTITNHEQM